MGGKCPKEVFRGLSPDSQLLSVKAHRSSTVEVLSLSEIRAAQFLNVQKLHQAVQRIHNEVSGLVSKSGQRTIYAHNAKAHVRAHTLTSVTLGQLLFCLVVGRTSSLYTGMDHTG
jgi:hypothetical protein